MAELTAKISGRQKRPIGGPGYYLFLAVAAFKDFLDLVKFIFLALPVIGWIFWAIFWMFGLFVNLMLLLYLKLNRVEMTSRAQGKIMAMFGVEMLPILGVIPMTTLMYFFTVRAENKARKKRSRRAYRMF